jgi:hypothetical protein
MQISSIGTNYTYNKTERASNFPSFQHFHNEEKPKDEYSTKQKALVTATSALGVAASLAVLAKTEGYSLKPSKMFKNIKNSFLAKVDFEPDVIIPIGIGTCGGGLAGGYLIDKDPENRKAKRREAVMQLGNISIPICTVAIFGKIGGKFGKVVGGISSIAGIFAGVHLANIMMNGLSNKIFHNKDEARDVKTTDFSAHVDDMLLAASNISKAKWVRTIARVIPAVLTVPGFEVGTKQCQHRE